MVQLACEVRMNEGLYLEFFKMFFKLYFPVVLLMHIATVFN